MVTVAPEAIQAREDSRRACLRIWCRRGCMPEGYAQRGYPAGVCGVRRLRLDARSGSRSCRCEEGNGPSRKGQRGGNPSGVTDEEAAFGDRVSRSVSALLESADHDKPGDEHGHHRDEQR